MNSKTYIILLLFSCMISCKKEAGEGGRACITGKIIAKNIRAQNIAYSSEDALSRETVYISYGDNEVFNDDVKTNEDGTFKFDYLRPGTYTICVYSLDSTLKYGTGGNAPKVLIKKTIEISKSDRKSVVDIGAIGVLKEANDGGSAQIKGKVFAKYYNGSFTVFQGQGYAPDEDVMIIYGDGTTVSDDTKTSGDGSFEFSYLRKGKYTVYVISEDNTLQNPSDKIIMKKEIEIKEKNQQINLDDFVIYK